MIRKERNWDDNADNKMLSRFSQKDGIWGPRTQEGFKVWNLGPRKGLRSGLRS